MSVSMRDLQSSSDDDDDDDDDDDMPTIRNIENTSKTNQQFLHSPLLKNKSQSAINLSHQAYTEKGDIKDGKEKQNSLESNPYASKTLPRSSPTIKIQPSMGHDAANPNSLDKSSWFREQVSGSLKKLSTRISPSNSLDSSLDMSFDETYFTKTDVKKEDLSTKSRWLKGHLNNYITKSKNLYYKRASTSTDEELTEENKTECNEGLSSLTIMTEDSHLPILQSKALPSPSSKSVEMNFPLKNGEHNLSTLVGEKICKRSAEDKPPQQLSYSKLLHQQTTHVSTPTTPEEHKIFEVSETNEVEENMLTENEINLLTNQFIKEDLENHCRPSPPSTVSIYHLLAGTIFLFPYFMLAYPTVFHYIITGGVLSYIYCCFATLQLCPSSDSVIDYRKNLRAFIKDNLRGEKKLTALPKADLLQRPKEIKGWLQYSANYEDYAADKSLMRDVYVVLHESTLYMYICQHNIPDDKQHRKPKKQLKGKQRLMARQLADKLGPAFTFTHEYHFNLSKCSFQLKPDDLPIRRIWNKKYPMRFAVPAYAFHKRSIHLTLEELTLNLEEILSDEVERSNAEETDEMEVFYLFGNSGREKEDWFYRIQLCVSPLKHQTTLQDIRRQRVSSEPAHSYPHYMVELIGESERVIQRNIHGKKVEPYLAWINVFLGRAFWDFWHDQYWTEKLQQKIQSRLNKINTPPFIKEIKLKELNCGHTIPIIHKGSLPVLDEYGVWTDLQVTYKGYFTLTLETQLNVDYYAGLVSGIVKEKLGKEATKMSDISELNLETDRGHYLEEHDCHDDIPDVYLDAFDDTDAGVETDTVMTDPRTKAFLQSTAGKKVVGLVSWLAKSKIAKRVAETEFAKKAYGRACEKFRKMPIILKVEIQSLKGNLAVNIPPPPTNRVWFGFRGNPVIFITASPRVGDKQVRLTYLTSWIEKKLKEEFKKYLVLPAMQDLSIKLMDSQLGNIYPNRPST